MQETLSGLAQIVPTYGTETGTTLVARIPVIKENINLEINNMLHDDTNSFVSNQRNKLSQNSNQNKQLENCAATMFYTTVSSSPKSFFFMPFWRKSI